jgi:hypothetical protein
VEGVESGTGNKGERLEEIKKSKTYLLALKEPSTRHQHEGTMPKRSSSQISATTPTPARADQHETAAPARNANGAKWPPHHRHGPHHLMFDHIPQNTTSHAAAHRGRAYNVQRVAEGKVNGAGAGT